MFNSLLVCRASCSFRESQKHRTGGFFRGFIKSVEIKFITEAGLLRNYFTVFFNFIPIGGRVAQSESRDVVAA